MNIIKIIRYTLKTDRVAENEQRIKAVFRQIRDKKLAGVEYAVYKLADGASFMHILSYETASAHETFINLPAFQEFQAQAKDRFEELPLVSDVEEIGFY
jgi:quinol monooxygenase YgiN